MSDIQNVNREDAKSQTGSESPPGGDDTANHQASWLDKAVASGIDEMILLATHSQGAESAYSRIERESKMLNDGLIDGIADKFRQPANLGADLAVRFSTATLVGSVSSIASSITTRRYAAIPGLIALGSTIGPVGFPRSLQIIHAVGDCWNHPENYKRDEAIVRTAAPVLLDSAATFWGLKFGARH
jgi:hypothetical protein